MGFTCGNVYIGVTALLVSKLDDIATIHSVYYLHSCDINLSCFAVPRVGRRLVEKFNKDCNKQRLYLKFL